MQFKAWSWWSLYMFAVMLVVAVGAWIGPFIKHEPPVLVAAALTSGAAGYIAFRYWQARQRLAEEHVAWIESFQVNVFCTDASTRERWSSDLLSRIETALQDVAHRTRSMHVGPLDIRLVSDPFAFRQLPGRNKGVYDAYGGVVLWWPVGRLEPEVMRYEFARAVVAREQGLYGDEAAAFIHREYHL